MVYVLMVNPQVPAKSVTELIALAKKSPGKLRYGSAARAAGSISPPSCSRT